MEQNILTCYIMLMVIAHLRPPRIAHESESSFERKIGFKNTNGQRRRSRPEHEPKRPNALIIDNIARFPGVMAINGITPAFLRLDL